MWSALTFPSGWLSEPHKRSADYKGSGDRLAACAGAENVQAPVDVDALDFTDERSHQATLDVAIYMSSATVDADFAGVSSPGFADCAKADLIRSLGVTRRKAPGVVVDVTNPPPPAGASPRRERYAPRSARTGRWLVVFDIVPHRR